MLELEEILVPVDFSSVSAAMVEAAAHLGTGEHTVIILQHVIDPSLAEFVGSQGFADRNAAIARMRERAESQLSALAQSVSEQVDVQTLISEGVPFYEILRVADELAVDAVVIGKHGLSRHPENIFFGSTAERVVRGCNRPVIVLPAKDP